MRWRGNRQDVDDAMRDVWLALAALGISFAAVILSALAGAWRAGGLLP